jgi:hypothetical protein
MSHVSDWNRELTVVFGDRNEARQTGLGVKSLGVKRIVSRKRADWCMIPVLLVLWLGRVTYILLEECRRLTEVVDVREGLDDIPKRLIAGSFSIDGNDLPDTSGDVFKMVEKFDAVVAVFRWVRVSNRH